MQAPLLANEGGGSESTSRVPDSVKKGCKKCLLYVGGVLLVLFAIAGIIQLICYNFALLGCSASSLRGYTFPGGGKSDLGDAAYNLVPRVALLIQRDPVWWGEGFDLFPSDSASTISGATTGFFYKTWGPFFNTYAYEDTASSKVTMYMRQRFPQSYLFMSHVIARCDGNGPTVVVTEGSGGFIVNRIRALFKMNQGYHFQVWVDDVFVGVAQEIGQHGSGIPSILFRNSTGATMGSSTLQSRHFHGNKDEWLVTNEEDTKIPFYANAALTLNFAFHIHNHDTKEDHPLKGKPDDKPSLAARDEIPEEEQATPGESSNASLQEAVDANVMEARVVEDAEQGSEAQAPSKEEVLKDVTEDADQGKDKTGKEESKDQADKTADSKSKSEEKPDGEEKKEQEEQEGRSEEEKYREKDREEEEKYRKKGREEEEKYRKEGREEEEKYRTEEQEWRRHEDEERSKEEQPEPAEQHKEREAQHKEKSTDSSPEEKDSSKEQMVVS